MIIYVILGGVFMIFNIIQKFENLINNLIDIVAHPIKNISYISAFVLYFILCPINIYKLSGKEMFLFSAGMVTILTFIVTFFQSVTVESSNKENFYLGYNLKRNLYDNFWIKRLYDMNIKLYLWFILSIPCLRIATNYNYVWNILNNINDFLKKYENNIYCIWMSIVVVVCIYCAAVLIESINLTRNKFKLSNYFDPRNERAKFKIRLEVKKEYKNYFKSILNTNIIDLFINSHNEVNVDNLNEYLFNKSTEVTSTKDELDEYLMLSFEVENDCIYRIYDKINNLINSISENNKSDIKKLKLYLLGKYLEKIKDYYVRKWKRIKQSLYYEISFLAICKSINYDLNVINKLENTFSNQTEDIKKIYNDIFEEHTSLDEMSCSNNEKVRNVCTSRIIDVLIDMCNNSKMYEELNFEKDIYIIFNTLNRGYVSKNYISDVFDEIFRYALGCENREGDFIKNFCKKINNNNAFIRSEAEKCSYDKIMSGDSISDFQLKWLLSLINNNDVCVALIFYIAYAERSGKGYMSVDTYRIWRDRISELVYKDTIYELNNDGYIDELIEKISKSRVSHFIYPQFIKWLWNSLFVNFDSIMYQQFKKLREEGIRKNFSLCSYMIFRSLLLDKARVYNSILFTESENNEIQKELLQIERILL